MAFIERKTFVLSPTTDVYFGAVGNTNGYVRTLNIGSQWSQIRVGVQYSIRPDGTNNLANGFFVMAMNFTKTNAYPFGSPGTANNFYGFVIPSGNTLTYNAGGGNPYYSNTQTVVGKRVGSTSTNESADAITHYHPTNTGSTQRRGIVYMDFNKFDGTTAMWVFSTASHVQVDYSEAIFLAQLASTTDPAPSGNTMVKNSFTGNGVTDSGGALDSFSMYYQADVVQTMEVYNIAIYRFI